MSGGRDRNALLVMGALGVRYTHALRLLREGKVKVVDGVVVDIPPSP